MKHLRKWIEETHKAVHRIVDKKETDHKAGYYDWLVALAVEKIVDEFNKLNKLNNTNDSLIDEINKIDIRLRSLEYQMVSFKERAEEILSENAPTWGEEKGAGK